MAEGQGASVERDARTDNVRLRCKCNRTRFAVEIDVARASQAVLVVACACGQVLAAMLDEHWTRERVEERAVRFRKDQR